MLATRLPGHIIRVLEIRCEKEQLMLTQPRKSGPNPKRRRAGASSSVAEIALAALAVRLATEVMELD